ncbi:MAG: GntR family transcriptional regulator [Clostridia bacterium]|nr:GntR family transcriptional regulator [Clostridia bacterium]
MFTVDKCSRTPIYEQLIRQFEYRILSGDIPANGLLPSVRSLSQELGINPNTLQRAYFEIEKRGICYSVAGSGRYLTPDAMQRIREHAIAKTQDFRAGVVSLREHGIPADMLIKIISEVYQEGKAVEV